MNQHRTHAAVLAAVVLGILLLSGFAAPSAHVRTVGSARPLLTPSSFGVPGPSARVGAGMAYDYHDHYSVLFGGANTATMNDTWVYAAGNWSQIHPKTSPSARGAATMVYDGLDGYVLMFGGLSSSNTQLNETWSFVHGQWTQLFPNVTPPARDDAGLAYDVVGHSVIMFGGGAATGLLGDTWSFAHGQWTQLFPTGAPPYRRAAAMAYDVANGYTVLFGGLGNLSDLSDTWTYAKGTWTQLTPTHHPGIRVAPAMAYDAQLKRLVLFGGRDDNTRTAESDTWFFHNGTWGAPFLGVHPVGRWFPSFDYDVGARAILLFGGEHYSGTSSTGYVNLGDTERFDSSGW